MRRRLVFRNPEFGHELGTTAEVGRAGPDAGARRESRVVSLTSRGSGKLSLSTATGASGAYDFTGVGRPHEALLQPWVAEPPATGGARLPAAQGTSRITKPRCRQPPGRRARRHRGPPARLPRTRAGSISCGSCFSTWGKRTTGSAQATVPDCTGQTRPYGVVARNPISCRTECSETRYGL